MQQNSLSLSRNTLVRCVSTNKGSRPPGTRKFQILEVWRNRVCYSLHHCVIWVDLRKGLKSHAETPLFYQVGCIMSSFYVRRSSLPIFDFCEVVRWSFENDKEFFIAKKWGFFCENVMNNWDKSIWKLKLVGGPINCHIFYSKIG